MIKNGRPYTIENGYEDAGLITEHEPEEIEAVGKWITENIEKSDDVYERRTSYGIKHVLQGDTGVYLTNNEFKDAMLLSGFPPVDPDELNWRYRIRMPKEENRNPGPFFAWVKERYLGEDSPEGDFAEDMVADRNFPVFAERGIIRRYLRRIGACTDAIHVFDRLWEEYAAQTEEEKVEGEQAHLLEKLKPELLEAFGKILPDEEVKKLGQVLSEMEDTLRELFTQTGEENGGRTNGGEG